MESVRYKPKVYNAQCNSNLIYGVYEKSSLHELRLLGSVPKLVRSLRWQR
jgi:hypothetical protein